MSSSAQTKTAVALMIFNRPQTTQRVFQAVAQARPPRLLVVADGPRTDRPHEAEICQQTRAIVENVNWPCQVETHFSDINLGCRKRISTGLDWVFSRAEEAIILEDDCLPDPSFFPYCDELLSRYRNDTRIHMIRGGNFLTGRLTASTSYHFSRWYHIWGWATWARAWEHNDVTMARWPELRDGGWLDDFLPLQAMRDKARDIFDKSYAGQIDTWEYEWVFSSWARDALAISPAVNLVTNIGFGPDAAHYQTDHHPHANMATQPMGFPLRHPPAVKVSEEIDLLEWRLVNPHLVKPSLPRRAYRRLRKLIRSAL